MNGKEMKPKVNKVYGSLDSTAVPGTVVLLDLNTDFETIKKRLDILFITHNKFFPFLGLLHRNPNPETFEVQYQIQRNGYMVTAVTVTDLADSDEP